MTLGRFMKAALFALIIGAFGLVACSGSQSKNQRLPATPSEPRAPIEPMNADDFRRVGSLNGAEIEKLVQTLLQIQADHPNWATEQLIQSLDARFEVKCNENCEIKERENQK